MTARTGYLILILALVLGFGIVGNLEYADSLNTDADLKLMRVQVATRGELIVPMTHPMHCGSWIKSCADFEPCTEKCLERE